MKKIGSAYYPEINADKLQGRSAESFQDELIPAFNIKNVNDEGLIGSGSIYIRPAITATLPGDVTLPFSGTARRYISDAQTFDRISVSCSSAATFSVVINKNGTPVATINMSNEIHKVTADTFSATPGDYFTINITGSGQVSDIVVVMDKRPFALN